MGPIYDLQTMLRWIHPETLHGKDGIYGKETASLVREFQKQNGLPVNGETDQQTWDAIVLAYEEALINQAKAAALEIILQPHQVIGRNDRNQHLRMMQAMLQTLSDYYAEMPVAPVNGTLDEPTADAVLWLQTQSGLPGTGEIDRNTWRYLTKNYRSVVGDGTGQFPIRIAQRPSPITRTTTE